MEFLPSIETFSYPFQPKSLDHMHIWLGDWHITDVHIHNTIMTQVYMETVRILAKIQNAQRMYIIACFSMYWAPITSMQINGLNGCLSLVKIRPVCFSTEVPSDAKYLLTSTRAKVGLGSYPLKCGIQWKFAKHDCLFLTFGVKMPGITVKGKPARVCQSLAAWIKKKKSDKLKLSRWVYKANNNKLCPSLW